MNVLGSVVLRHVNVLAGLSGYDSTLPLSSDRRAWRVAVLVITSPAVSFARLATLAASTRQLRVDAAGKENVVAESGSRRCEPPAFCTLKKKRG